MVAFAALTGVGVLAALLIATQSARRAPIRYVVTGIYVMPFGLVPGGDLQQVVSVLQQDFPHIAVRFGASLPLPLAAFNRARRQFNVDVLLLDLQRQPGNPSVRLVGVTIEDIYAPGSDYVFATTDAQRDTVISVARLDSPDRALTVERYRKILRRQLGFTFGFQSSRDQGCAMFYTTTLAGLDAKGSAWCGGEADAIRKIQGLP